MNALNSRSHERLKGVAHDLVDVVEKAIVISELGFQITCGLRNEAQQAELVKKGVSWTMKSRHLTGHAVDVVAYVADQVSWDMRCYAKIAEAFQKASLDSGVHLTWGAVWDRDLWDLSLAGDGFNDDIDQYVARFKAAHNKRPRLDGPHFELHKKFYP